MAIGIKTVLPILAVVLSVSGCSIFSDHVEDTAVGSAIIVGSKQYDDDPRIGDSRSYLIAIDGQPVGKGPSSWDDAVTLTPGWHSFRYGISRNLAFLGVGDTQAKLAAGKTYVLRATKPKQMSQNLFAADGWIEDDGGIAVSNRQQIQIAPTGLTAPSGSS